MSANSEYQGGDTANNDNDYKSRTGQYQVPVQSDEAPVSDPIDARTADSDETLSTFLYYPPFTCNELTCIPEADEKAAMDESNIIDERTRGAAKKSYAEPGDEEGLPSDDGTSNIRTGA